MSVQWRQVGDLLTLDGAIDFADAAFVRDEGLRRLAALPAVAIDVSALTRVDSITVAVLLAWWRAAQRMGRPWHLQGASERLQAIAGVSGLSFLFVRDAGNRSDQ